MRLPRLLAPAALVALPTLAQDRPAAPQDKDNVVVIAPAPDIDLTGPRPMVREGLWRFDHSSMLSFGGGGAAARPFHFSICLPGDDLEGTLRRAAGERSAMPGQDWCGKLSATVKDGRIAGRRSCTRIARSMGTSHSELKATLSGRYDARSLTIDVGVEEQTDGLSEGTSVPRPKGWRWRVTAARLGECPVARVPGQRSLTEAAAMLFNVDIPIWADPDGI